MSTCHVREALQFQLGTQVIDSGRAGQNPSHHRTRHRQQYLSECAFKFRFCLVVFHLCGTTKRY